MDFESDRSNDDRAGENATTPVVQNQNEVEENLEKDEAALPRESRNRRPPERYKTYKNADRIMKQLIHLKPKIGEKL